MRLTASDFASCHRPTRCDLRVFLRHQREKEAESGPYDIVLRRLGLRHERDHLATLGTFANASAASLEEQVKKTAESIEAKVPVLYQPAFLAVERICGTDVEIVGVPDYLILDGDGYVIRDSKMARRIDEENHPEILLQLQLYGWLFERSCGIAPNGLQVCAGTGEIVTIPLRWWGSRSTGIGAALDYQATDCGTLRTCWLDKVPRLRVYRPLLGAGREEQRCRTRVLRGSKPCSNSPQPRSSHSKGTTRELRRHKFG